MKYQITKCLPTILTIGASIGVIAVAALSSLSYPKAMKTYQEILDLETDDKYKKWKAGLKASRHYLVPAIVGSLTITCIVEANILNKKEKALLLSSYIGLQEYVKTYREKIADEIIIFGIKNSQIEKFFGMNQSPNRSSGDMSARSLMRNYISTITL